MQLKHAGILTEAKSTSGSWKMRWRSSKTRLIWQVVSWRKRKEASLLLTESGTWKESSLGPSAATFGKALSSTESGTATLLALPQQELSVFVTITYRQGLNLSSPLREDAWYKCHQAQLRS